MSAVETSPPPSDSLWLPMYPFEKQQQVIALRKDPTTAEARHTFETRISQLLQYLDQNPFVGEPTAVAATQHLITAINEVVKTDQQFAPLLIHLKEVQESLACMKPAFSMKACGQGDAASATPNRSQLDDCEFDLLETVIAPLHDRLKLLGPPQAQLPEEHELLIGIVVRRYFTKWQIPDAVVEFISEVVSDHENDLGHIPRATLLERHPSPISTAKAIMYLADAFTGGFSMVDGRLTADYDKLVERFGDIIYRHGDPMQSDHFQPDWAVTACREVASVLSYFQDEQQIKLDANLITTIIEVAQNAVQKLLNQSLARRFDAFQLNRNAALTGVPVQPLAYLTEEQHQTLTQILQQLQTLKNEQQQSVETITANQVDARLRMLMDSILYRDGSGQQLVQTHIQDAYVSVSQVLNPHSRIGVEDSPETYQGINAYILLVALNQVRATLKDPASRARLIATVHVATKNPLHIPEPSSFEQQLVMAVAQTIHDHYERNFHHYDRTWVTVDMSQEKSYQRQQKSLVIAFQVVRAIISFCATHDIHDIQPLTTEEITQLLDINIPSAPTRHLASQLQALIIRKSAEQLPQQAKASLIDGAARTMHEIWLDLRRSSSLATHTDIKTPLVPYDLLPLADQLKNQAMMVSAMAYIQEHILSVNQLTTNAFRQLFSLIQHSFYFMFEAQQPLEALTLSDQQTVLRIQEQLHLSWLGYQLSANGLTKYRLMQTDPESPFTFYDALEDIPVGRYLDSEITRKELDLLTFLIAGIASWQALYSQHPELHALPEFEEMAKSITDLQLKLSAPSK